jgi:CRP/FNR family cyclic AMP-dependent transcriptional regulator
MQLLELTPLKHPFVAGMHEDHLRTLAGLATGIHFPEGNVIFREGDPANWFYLIERGKLAVEAAVRGRGTIVVQTIESGEVLGWSWLFEPFTWHFSARATMATDALLLDAKRLREECEKEPRLGYELTRRVAQVLMRRLQATQSRLSDVCGARSVKTWKEAGHHDT